MRGLLKAGANPGLEGGNMQKQWIVVGIAVMGVSLTAFGAPPQDPGPQGAGASEAAKSSAPHSLNPVKWVKKAPNTTTEQPDARTDQSTMLTSALQTQGVIPANTDLKNTCSPIKGLDECVAALHARHNLGLDFDCLKSNLTGTRTDAETSPCKGSPRKRAMSLSSAIRALKPDVNAKAEAQNAEKQAREDFKRGRT
jgi:hypothetical protein